MPKSFRIPIIKKSPLPVLVECAVATPDDKPATFACHETLQCQRCGKCLIHCECGPAQIKPQGKALSGDQLSLCEKPRLHLK